MQVQNLLSRIEDILMFTSAQLVRLRGHFWRSTIHDGMEGAEHAIKKVVIVDGRTLSGRC